LQLILRPGAEVTAKLAGGGFGVLGDTAGMGVAAGAAGGNGDSLVVVSEWEMRGGWGMDEEEEQATFREVKVVIQLHGM
jgi:hypothetical protein